MAAIWVVLVVVTHNVGSATAARVHQALAGAHVAALQECGDRDDLLELLVAHGWALITGGKPGQASTPLLYRPERLKLIKAIRFQLAPAQYVGRGAGPSTMKAKWVIGGLFWDRKARRLVIVVSTHYVASQHYHQRRQLAVALSRKIVNRFRLVRVPVIVLADWNTPPDRAGRAPIRDAGWVHTRAVASHGLRPIDGAEVLDPRGVIHAPGDATVTTTETGSDHLLVRVLLRIKVRSKRRFRRRR